MYLKPSEIFFSQDSINNVFDKNCGHRYRPIGETLDALCNGSCSIHSIPTISVVKKDGKWFTADNRRLWVFRNLERLGKCSEICVREGSYIPSSKFTTYNGGESVVVRNGSPGGYWHRRPSVQKPPPAKPAIIKPPALSKDDNKENIPAKSAAVNDTINKANRSPFRQLDSVILDIRNEPKTMRPEIYKADSTMVTETENVSIRKTTMDGYNSKLFTLNVDKSSRDDCEIPVIQKKDNIIKDDSCHVQVDEDNNNIINNDASFVYDTGSVVAYPETRTHKTAKNISRKCIAAVVAAVVIAAVLLSVVIATSV